MVAAPFHQMPVTDALLAQHGVRTPLEVAGGNNLRIGVATSLNRSLDAAFIHGPTTPWIFDGGIRNAFTKSTGTLAAQP